MEDVSALIEPRGRNGGLFVLRPPQNAEVAPAQAMQNPSSSRTEALRSSSVARSGTTVRWVGRRRGPLRKPAAPRCGYATPTGRRLLTGETAAEPVPAYPAPPSRCTHGRRPSSRSSPVGPPRSWSHTADRTHPADHGPDLARHGNAQGESHASASCRMPAAAPAQCPRPTVRPPRSSSTAGHQSDRWSLPPGPARSCWERTSGRTTERQPAARTAAGRRRQAEAPHRRTASARKTKAWADRDISLRWKQHQLSRDRGDRSSRTADHRPARGPARPRGRRGTC